MFKRQKETREEIRDRLDVGRVEALPKALKALGRISSREVINNVSDEIRIRNELMDAVNQGATAIPTSYTRDHLLPDTSSKVRAIQPADVPASTEPRVS